MDSSPESAVTAYFSHNSHDPTITGEKSHQSLLLKTNTIFPRRYVLTGWSTARARYVRARARSLRIEINDYILSSCGMDCHS